MSTGGKDEQVKVHKAPFQTNQDIGLQIKKKLTTDPRGVPAVPATSPSPAGEPEPPPTSPERTGGL